MKHKIKCWSYWHYTSPYNDNEHNICQVVPNSYMGLQEVDPEEANFFCMRVVFSSHPAMEFSKIGEVYQYTTSFVTKGGNDFHRWKPIAKEDIPFLLMQLLGD